MFAVRNKAGAQPERREAPREDVYYRTRATAAGVGAIGLQVVNISANGFMARTEADFAPGDTLSVKLPVAGVVVAEVRWALGGRIGCQFGRMIELAPYLEMLGELMKGAR